MVVNDFNLVWAGVVPAKTNPPLGIDSNAVLSFAIAFQRFKHVPWRNPQAVQFRCGMEHEQFSTGHTFNVGKARNLVTVEESFGVQAKKRLNHGLILFRETESINRNTR